MDYVHPVDMTRICDRLGLSLRDVSVNLGFSSEKSMYKWRVIKKFGEKNPNSARPDFETCLKLIEMGATIEEIFGVKLPHQNSQNDLNYRQLAVHSKQDDTEFVTRAQFDDMKKDLEEIKIALGKSRKQLG